MIMGKSFSPSLAEIKTGLRFASKNEPGDVGKKGRYRNVPTPHGAARLELSNDNYSALQELLGILSKNINLLRDCGAEEIKYYLTVSYKPEEEQCNLEFDALFLKALGELDVPLLISI